MRQVRIFVSSPGDVGHERRRVDRVVERLNGEFAGVAHLASVRWETRFYQAHTTFQAQIPAAAECDIVVAIFRARLGTELPPDFPRMPHGAPYPSGTAYEVLSAIAARRQQDLPDVYVFRHPEPPTVRLDDPEAARVQQQWEQLKAFFDTWFAAPEGPLKAAFHTFASTDDFEAQLDRLLHRWLEDKVLHGRAAPWPIETKGSPFRGLAAFGAKHAPVFFGRSRDIARGVDHWKVAAERGTPFLLVVGASGAGKSSLVRAGLVARLVVPGVVPAVDVWRVAVMRPSETPGGPVASLATRLLDTEQDIPEDEAGRPPALPEIADSDYRTPAELASLLAHADATALSPLLRALERVGEAERARQGYTRPLRVDLVLVVDQLDELFGTDVAAAERARFSRLLALLVETSRVWVVATLRADLYERFLAEPALLALKTSGAAYDLTPPGPTELAEIVQKPAEAAGLVFETDPTTGERLDERLLREADRADMLPLLQLALERLFVDRVVVAGETRLTNAAHAALGGLAGVIDREAERAVAALGEVELSRLPRLLRQLVGVSHPDSAEGPAPLTIRTVPLAAAATDEPSRRLLRVLVEARILLSSDEGVETTIRLVHQRVLADWARARELIAASMDFYRIRDEVEEQRRRWQAAGARSDLLIPRGLPLAEAESIAARFGDELSAQTQEFIVTSGRRARARQRLTAAAAILFALLAIAATGAGTIAWRERQQAVAEEHRAEAEKTRAEAEKARAEVEKTRAEAERTRAEGNLDAAKQAVGSLVFDIAQGLRNEGVHTQTMRKVLDRVKGTVERLSHNAPDDSDLLSSRAAMLSEFVDSYLSAGDLGDARKSAEEALEIRRGLVGRDPGNQDWQHNVPVSLDQIGDIRTQMDDAAGALAAYEEGLVIRRRLAEGDPGNEEWRGVPMSLDRIGRVKERLGDAGAALAAYEEGLAIRRRLAEGAPGNLQRRRDVSLSLERIGDIRGQVGAFGDALAVYQEGLDIRRGLAKANPGNPQWQEDLGFFLRRIGRVKLLEGDNSGAIAADEEALAIERRLAEGDPGNTGWQRGISIILDSVAEAKLASDDATGARGAREEGLTIRRRLAERDPANMEWQRDLSISLDSVGDLKLNAGDVGGARRAYEEGLTIRRRLADRDPSNMERQRDLSLILYRIGDAALHADDLVKARAAYEEGLAIARRLAGRDPKNVEWQRTVLILLQRTGNTKARAGDQAGALADYEEGLGIALRLAKQVPGSMQLKMDVVTTLEKVAAVSSGERRKAVLRQAVTILEGLDSEKKLSSDQAEWLGALRSELAQAH